MKARFVFSSLVALFLLPTAASAQSALDKLIAGAKTEKELNFMSFGFAFGGADAMPKLEAAFNRKYGTNMKLNFTPGPSMPALAARIIEEYKSGVHASTDVLFGNQSTITGMKKADALQEVDWTGTFPWVTPQMVVTKGVGVMVWTGLATMTYNGDLIKPADAPTKYEDLVDPAKSKAWAGKLAIPQFNDWLVELSLIWAKPKVLDFASKLGASATGVIRYAEYDRLMTGEFAVMANESDGPSAAVIAADKGAHVVAVAGSTPSQAYYNQLAVPKNSASPNLAKLFVAFMASPEGQAISDSIGHEGSYLVPGTRVAKFVEENKLALIPPPQIADFYDRGGDPDFATEIGKALKH